jgi:hypothetical protein
VTGEEEEEWRGHLAGDREDAAVAKTVGQRPTSTRQMGTKAHQHERTRNTHMSYTYERWVYI